MKRRRLYQLAAEWAAEGTGLRRIALNVGDAMRRRRGLPVRGKAAKWEDDPEIGALLDSDDALGQVYQALRAPELEAAYRASAKRKFTPAEIPAVTQLFTPAWVVRFLVQNTLGRMWVGMHPDSRLKSKMEFLVEDEALEVACHRVADLRVCDPACGTMNFGLVAIDLLMEMYQEEADRAGRRGWPKEPSPADGLAKNLVGFDIDPLALDLARISIGIKLRRSFEIELLQADALFDSRIQAQAFDVVVTNPPYLSSRNLPRTTVEKMKSRYPSAWRDAYACFLLRSLELLKQQGRLGILAMHSFMFTGGFEKLRQELTDQAAIEAIAHFGPGLFEVGNPGTLQTAGIILRREFSAAKRDRQMISAWRLVDCDDKEAGLRKLPASQIRQKELKKLPRQAWSYWAGPQLVRILSKHPKLSEIAPPRQGLATTDNGQFVRYWWEVEPPGFAGPRPRWVPYVKSGRFRRWYEAPRHRVDWEDDGRRIKESIVRRYPYLNGKWAWVAKNSQYYGRAGITYSYLTSGTFSARRLEAGSIFDVAGSSLFPDDALVMLAILNSSAAAQLLGIINPTVNFQVGDLGELPVPRGGEHLRPLVSRAIEIQRTLDSFDETTTDFVSPVEWKEGESNVKELYRELGKVEKSIDRQVSELYGVKHVAFPARAIEELDRVDLARRWVGYALRQANPASGDPIDKHLLKQVRDLLPSEEIEATVGSLKDFFDGPFERWHNRLYRNRPLWRLNGRTIISSLQSAHL